MVILLTIMFIVIMNMQGKKYMWGGCIMAPMVRQERLELGAPLALFMAIVMSTIWDIKVSLLFATTIPLVLS